MKHSCAACLTSSCTRNVVTQLFMMQSVSASGEPQAVMPLAIGESVVYGLCVDISIKFLSEDSELRIHNGVVG